MWKCTFHDGTGSHPLATTTYVDKSKFPDRDAAQKQAAAQLGINVLHTKAQGLGQGSWWEVV